MFKSLKKLFKTQEEHLRQLRQRLPEHESGIAGLRAPLRPLTRNHVVLEDSHDLATVDRFIWHVVKGRLETMGADETLVVLAGECHVMPMTILPQAGLLANLATWRDEAPGDPARRFLYAFEAPYDVLYSFATEAFKKNLPSEARQLLHPHDPDGHIAVKSIIAHDDIPHAPLAVEQVLWTALKHDISFCFNDASFDQGFRLLAEDPIAQRIAHEEYKMDLGQKRISRVMNPYAMPVRNAVMVERALEASREKGARIIVQRAGMAHLYGDPPDKSLTARFNAAGGCRTIGIYFRYDRQAITNTARSLPAMVRDNPDHIIIDNAASAHFMRSRKDEERVFIDRLLSSYGPEGSPYGRDGGQVSEAEARAMIDDVLRKAGLQELPPQPRWWARLKFRP